MEAAVKISKTEDIGKEKGKERDVGIHRELLNRDLSTKSS